MGPDMPRTFVWFTAGFVELVGRIRSDEGFEFLALLSMMISSFCPIVPTFPSPRNVSPSSVSSRIKSELLLPFTTPAIRITSYNNNKANEGKDSCFAKFKVNRQFCMLYYCNSHTICCVKLPLAHNHPHILCDDLTSIMQPAPSKNNCMMGWQPITIPALNTAKNRQMQ